MIAALQGSAPTAPETLRRVMRARRSTVSTSEGRAAAEAVVRHVAHALPLRAGARIALFLSLREELDTAPLLAWAQRRAFEVFLPVVVDRHACRMRFHRYTGITRMGAFGIAEPVGGASLGARWLDAVFLPLVAFDARGHRLGMGAGFYDRALAFRRARHRWLAPRLIGIGYAFQEVAAIEARPHDVRLDAVVTERGLRFFAGDGA